MAKRSKKRGPGKPTPKELRSRRRRRRQQQTLILAAAAVFAAIILILGFGYYRENIAIYRAPVAIVNGQTITTQDYQQMVRYQRFNLLASLGGQVNEQTLVNFLQNTLPQTALDSMIDQVFIEQYAAQAGLTVTDEELQQYIERQFGFTGEKPTPEAPASSDVTTTQSAETVTREQFNTRYNNFLEALKTQADLTESQYREIVRGQLLRNKVQERIGADVPTSAPQVHARHILVETEEEAQQIRQRLLNGEDFATVAQEVSTDTTTAQNGGDLGWFGLGKMVPEFEKVAFSQPIGTISEPVKTQFGYHIIEVLEKDDNRELTPDQLESARQERFRNWLDEQRASAQIERLWKPEMVPPLPAGLASAQPAPPIPPAPTSSQ